MKKDAGLQNRGEIKEMPKTSMRKILKEKKNVSSSEGTQANTGRWF